MIKIDYKDADNLSSALDNLYTIITLLRSPEGCPWDRIQTNKTATQSLIDESYEYLDGVIKGNVDSEREEIGDVMINVFMNLRLHEEQKDFMPYEAINEVCQKLIRRHPHVFGEEHADTAEGVLTLWNNVKENVEGHKEKSDDFFEHITDYASYFAMLFDLALQSGFDYILVDTYNSWVIKIQRSNHPSIPLEFSFSDFYSSNASHGSVFLLSLFGSIRNPEGFLLLLGICYCSIRIPV